MNDQNVVAKKEIKKLVELNDELENYFRNTIIPQLFVDADLILRKFSPPANKHFRFTAGDIGKSIHDIPNFARLPGVAEDIKAVIENNNDLEKEIQTEDLRWFQMNILPYIIKKENLTNGVVITFIDITDRINDKRDIEHLNSDHETFIYSVSHDFKGPLSNIVALIEFMRVALKADNKEELISLIKMLEDLAIDMKSMLSELTEITKIGTDKDSQSARINIETMVEEVKLALKNQIYRSHARITTSLLEPEVLFPRKNMRSILYNLISNAIKFTSPEKTPTILIKSEKSEEYIILSVKDNGMGMEEHQQTEIFSKFTRFHPDVEGTGVGLYIVSRMVSNTGGKIEVESKLNEGTTFSIYLKE